ncbi:helix-turn-helix domain-containing protein [Enterococcus raffinosus]|uniref:helix-turn-helix domain-containing protein n=1 Tax=Enterococcus raffinosus TaxID=71452 RepID=UPI0028913EB5|nr:helix-turn-helix domain-containing protein [Enterococcus raffinosus]
MSNLRHLRLIELLYACRTGLSSDQLLEELECSLSVLLKDVKLINSQQDSFRVQKYKGLYQLKIKSHISINRLYADTIQHSPEFQIIEELLYEECENIIDLSKKLYLSPSKTQRNLKKIEGVLSETGITLQYRPLRLEGNESVIRHMYYRYFIEKSDRLGSLYRELKEFQIKAITELVNQFIQLNKLEDNYISRKRLGYNMYISLWRIKNGHYYPKSKLNSDLMLPEKQMLDAFKRMAMEVFRLKLSSDKIKDCLWLSYGDVVVASKSQLQSALKKDDAYADFYYHHLELVEEFDSLLNFSLGNDKKQDLAIVLMNEHRIYGPDGQYIDILFRQRKIFLEKLSETHDQAVKKVKRIVDQFVHRYQIYQEEDFVWNYVYLLITMVPQSLSLLASCDRPLKLLLLSELSPTEEFFLGSQIENQIYGNFEVHYVEKKLSNVNIHRSELEKYDALITSSSVEEVPEEYPTVVIDPFLTNQDVHQLQQLISKLAG